MANIGPTLSKYTGAAELSALLESDKFGIVSVKTYGAVGDGVTDDTTAIQSTISNANNGEIIAFPRGTYLVSNLTFANNSNIWFQNCKFLRKSGSTGVFINSGTGSILYGNLEIDGNKQEYTPNKALIGISLQDDSVCYARIYSHDNAGHGIVVGSNCIVHNPKSNDNGGNPGPNGTADGIKLTSVNDSSIFNPYTTGNARMGVTVTTSPEDKTQAKNILIYNSYATGNSYNDIDIEYASYTTLQRYRGYGNVISSNSEYCNFYDMEVAGFYADTHDYCSVENLKIKPSGVAVNPFFLTGKNPLVKNIYGFDTATGYGTSTFVTIIDSTNQNATVENVVIENAYNGITVTGATKFLNCEVLTASNRYITCNARRTTTIYQRGFDFLDSKAIVNNFDLDPNTNFTGTWSIGDIAYQTTPTNGNYLGWICVTAGTPGTWSKFGIVNLQGSITWDPADLADGAGETSSDITATGAELGDFVIASAPYDLQGIICNAYVSSTDTVKIRIQNETGGNINLTSGTWRVKVIKK